MNISDQSCLKSNQVNKPSAVYSWVVVIILTLSLTLSFIDRMIINLLVDPIRADLGISDTQMSMLMGVSFLLFYAVLGLLIARLADSHSRKRILVFAVSVWTFMTAMCGFASSFFTFFLARLGVGAGEGGFSPAAYSLISDYFPRNRIGRAVSVYSMGINVGIGLAYILGGSIFAALTASNGISLPLVDNLKPWQLTFIIVALPGLILIPLLMTIREPVRKGLANIKSASMSDQTPDSGVWKFVKQNKKLIILHMVSFSLLAAVDYGFLSWLPSYYSRVRGVEVDVMGINFGLAYIFIGGIGMFAGAWLAEKLSSRGYHDAIYRVTISVMPIVAPLIWLVIILPDSMSYIAMGAYIFVFALPFGIAPAAVLLFTPNQYRAQMSAIYILSVNITAMTLGPTGVALFTDYVFDDELKVGLSIAVLSTIWSVMAVATLLFARKSYYKAVAVAERNENNIAMSDATPY